MPERPIPNTRRFFVPPAAIHGERALIDDPELAHQLARVLRLRPGERVLLLDGSGTAYTVVLEALGKSRVEGRVEAQSPAGGEPACALTLYVALLRAERFEWVLQKGTELGAHAFVPVHCARSQAADHADEKRLLRWRRIVREAAEQSCRGHLPAVAAPLPFAAACARATRADLALLLWEGQARTLRDTLRGDDGRWTMDHGSRTTDRGSPTGNDPSSIVHRPSSICLLSGPEGGIAPEELTAAVEHGIIPISLGPRILRAETAPIAAVAALMYELEQ